jgi:hypothetical protein
VICLSPLGKENPKSQTFSNPQYSLALTTTFHSLSFSYNAFVAELSSKTTLKVLSQTLSFITLSVFISSSEITKTFSFSGSSTTDSSTIGSSISAIHASSQFSITQSSIISEFSTIVLLHPTSNNPATNRVVSNQIFFI